MSTAGRKNALTKQALLKAIHDHQTLSPAELVKALKVSRATVYNYIDKLTPEEKNQALGIVDDVKLKPVEMEYAVFCEIPLVKEFYETLRFTRENGESYSQQMLRVIFRVCVALNVKPSALDLEHAKAFVLAIKKGENKNFGNGYDVRRAFRAWFGFKGISGQKLTNIGVHARIDKNKSRSKVRFTQEHRHKIREVARSKYGTNFKTKSGNSTLTIAFADDPKLALAMDAWFEFKYYTMTRKSATLNTCWESKKDENGKEWGVIFEEHRVVVKLVDKGKHGGICWEKKLIGQAAEHFKTFHERLGKPTSGLIFPFEDHALGAFLNIVYEEAGVPKQLWEGQPDHVWRHTGAQDLLDATGWNYALVAITGGWESIEILKEHYGEMPPEVQENQIRKAMRLPVIETPREFVF